MNLSAPASTTTVGIPLANSSAIAGPDGITVCASGKNRPIVWYAVRPVSMSIPCRRPHVPQPYQSDLEGWLIWCYVTHHHSLNCHVSATASKPSTSAPYFS